MLAIAYDPAFTDDPGLVSAAVDAVRFWAAENERLQPEVRAQIRGGLAPSRARLVPRSRTPKRPPDRAL